MPFGFEMRTAQSMWGKWCLTRRAIGNWLRKPPWPSHRNPRCPPFAKEPKRRRPPRRPPRVNRFRKMCFSAPPALITV